MYIIAFDTDKVIDYDKAIKILEANGVVPTLKSGNAWEAVAREEAKCAVENKLINHPSLYYKQNFNDDALVESIVENLVESDLIDQFYQEASDEFDNQVKNLLGDTYGI